jgi:hypothetical protein
MSPREIRNDRGFSLIALILIMAFLLTVGILLLYVLTTPAGIDIPYDAGYFRRLSDEELLAALDQNGDGTPDDPNVIFFKVPYITTPEGGLDPRYTYTAFLVDDEAGGGTPNPGDCLLICIGVVDQSGNLTTTRLEIGLAIQLSGTNP